MMEGDMNPVDISELTVPTPEERMANLQARGYSPCTVKTDKDRVDESLYYKLHGPDSATEKILLVGGLGSTGEVWDATVAMIFSRPDIGNSCQICTFDNRGTGQSAELTGRATTSNYAKDCVAILEHLGWERVHVVGSSLGGMISQELALLAPARLKSLTLCVTSAGSPSTPFKGIKLMISNMFESNVVQSLDYQMQIMFSAHTNADFNSERFKRLHGILAERTRLIKAGFANGKQFVYQYAATTTHKVGALRLKLLRDYKFPIIIVRGDEDNLVSTKNSDKLAKALDAPLIVVKNTGHGIIFESPAAIAEQVAKNIENSQQETIQL